MRMEPDRDLHHLDIAVDVMDYLDNFAVLEDKLVAVVTRDQMLGLVERLVNYSMADLQLVDDLDCQIFDSDRWHGHCTRSSMDCMIPVTGCTSPDCSYYHGHLVVYSN